MVGAVRLCNLLAFIVDSHTGLTSQQKIPRIELGVPIGPAVIDVPQLIPEGF
jgi:hypothetical protein